MSKQLLHLVFGGELVSLNAHEFRDLSKLHIVGIYPNFKEAQAAWKSAAQSTVDNAHMRYFVVHMHRLLDGEEDHNHWPDGEEMMASPARAVPRRATPSPKTAGKAKARPTAKPKSRPKTKAKTTAKRR